MLLDSIPDTPYRQLTTNLNSRGSEKLRELEVTRTYLEIFSPKDLRPAPMAGSARVERLNRCTTDMYRFLYRTVGERYHWLDRRSWTEQEVQAHVENGAVSIWVMHEAEQLAGYFELVQHKDGSVEIAYFGLLDEYLGRGLGKMLLTSAVDAAWSLGATRIWLHTCTLDHPAALPNYLARGFRQFKQERYIQRLDD